MCNSMKRTVMVALVLLLLPGMVQAQTVRPLVETTLTDFVPAWVKEGGRSDMLQRMVNPELRRQIEAEINAIVNDRGASASDIYLPELGDSVGTWMLAFDRETSFDYELEPGQALWSFVNLDYDNGNNLYVDEFTVYDLDKETVAFHYDFTGDDGDRWDPAAFGRDLFVAPRNPDAARYGIENNAGKMEVDPRRQGSASSYGKLTPIMDDLDHSEVLMRFRVDEVGLTQYLRVWVQSDKFGSGSSFAMNGYGIALHLGKDELTLQRREDSTTTALDAVEANMTTDWHWLRLRAAHGKVAVKLWNDSADEPEEWAIEYDIPAVAKKAMLSVANLDRDHDNTLHINVLRVGLPPFSTDVAFQHDFVGADGAGWDPEAFDQLHSYGVAYSIQQNTGRIELGKRQDMLNASYGKIVPHMGNPMDSDLLLRFRVDHVGQDQWMRAFVRADGYYDGNSSPKNGFGVELNLKANELTMFKMENKNRYHLARADANMTTDWHWLRLQILGNELAVRLWKDGENEPDDWNIVQTISESVSAGESIMRLLMLRGDPVTVY